MISTTLKKEYNRINRAKINYYKSSSSKDEIIRIQNLFCQYISVGIEGIALIELLPPVENNTTNSFQKIELSSMINSENTYDKV